MSKKPPRVELTFGNNDKDIYDWLVSKGISNATYVKRILREKMNEEQAGETIHSPIVPAATRTQTQENDAYVVEVVRPVAPTVVEPEEETNAPSGFAFMKAMQGNKDGREF